MLLWGSGAVWGCSGAALELLGLLGAALGLLPPPPLWIWMWALVGLSALMPLMALRALMPLMVALMALMALMALVRYPRPPCGWGCGPWWA